MDAIVSLWLHESPELRAGTAAAKAVVVQDAAAKAAVVQDTSSAPASAWKAMAFKDIQDLRRRREDSGSYNSDATEWYNRDASEEGREDSNVQSDSSDDSCDQSEDESSATDDDDEELAATSQLLHPKSPVIPVSTKWLSECLETQLFVCLGNTGVIIGIAIGGLVGAAGAFGLGMLIAKCTMGKSEDPVHIQMSGTSKTMDL